MLKGKIMIMIIIMKLCNNKSWHKIVTGLDTLSFTKKVDSINLKSDAIKFLLIQTACYRMRVDWMWI